MTHYNKLRFIFCSILNLQGFKSDYDTIIDPLLENKSRFIVDFILSDFNKGEDKIIINLQECSRNLYNKICKYLTEKFKDNFSSDFHFQPLFKLSSFKNNDNKISGIELKTLIEANTIDNITYDHQVIDDLKEVGFCTFIIYKNAEVKKPLRLEPRLIYLDIWHYDDNKKLSQFVIDNYGLQLTCRSCVVISESLDFTLINVHLKSDEDIPDKIDRDISKLIEVDHSIFELDFEKINWRLNKEEPPTTEENKALIIPFFRNILLRYIDKFTRVFDDSHLNKKQVVIVGDFNKKLEADRNEVITKLLDAHKQYIKTSFIDSIYLDHILVKFDTPIPEVESGASVSIWKPYTISQADASSRWERSASAAEGSSSRFGSLGRAASGAEGSSSRFSSLGRAASGAEGSSSRFSSLGRAVQLAPRVYKFKINDKVKKNINGTSYQGIITELTTYDQADGSVLNCYKIK
jgi:hypothetical protein